MYLFEASHARAVFSKFFDKLVEIHPPRIRLQERRKPDSSWSISGYLGSLVT